MEKTQTFDKKQKMLFFAFLADITSGVVFDVNEDLSKVQKNFQKEKLYVALESVISNKLVTQYIGDGWKCFPYPWVDIEIDPAKEYLSRNTTAIFTNGSEVVIAVAGTNFIENYDWFTEDLSVENQPSWKSVMQTLSSSYSGSANSGGIAEGTSKALLNTWNQKGAISGKNLLEDLKTVVSSMTEINLTVTGHSLGGAISPVVAQALYELSADWAPQHSTVKVSAYPFAGPTVGDQKFVDYVQPGGSQNGIDLVSTYNTKDEVPHGWNLKFMAEMSGLFAPFIKDANSSKHGQLIMAIINWLIKKSKVQGNYERWKNESTITGSLPKELSVEGAAIVAEAGVFAKVLLDNLSSSTLATMKSICGNPSDLKFYEDMVYFSKFLIMLGTQHIEQYSLLIYGSKEIKDHIHKAVSEAKKGWKSKGKLEAGMAVLEELFSEV